MRILEVLRNNFKVVSDWYLLQNEIVRWSVIAFIWIFFPTVLYQFSLESKWQEINEVNKKREKLEESKKEFDLVRGDDARVIYSNQIVEPDTVTSKIRALVGYEKDLQLIGLKKLNVRKIDWQAEYGGLQSSKSAQQKRERQLFIKRMQRLGLFKDQDNADESYGALNLGTYELTLEGKYDNILQYLNIVKSEKMPIYWSTMNYDVTERPYARAKLVMRILSKEG